MTDAQIRATAQNLADPQYACTTYTVQWPTNMVQNTQMLQGGLNGDLIFLIQLNMMRIAMPWLNAGMSCMDTAKTMSRTA